MSEENKYILQVKDLHTSFATDAGEVRAVNGVSFNLEPGKTLGIVGESGSGKSVTSYSIMQILAETGKITGGEVLYHGEDISKWNEKQMQKFRGEKCSIIFQDPMTSLNPVFTIENMRPIRDGMTVSRDSRLGTVNKITYFSMGAGTSISQESYDRMTMYITDAGSGTFLLGEEPKNVFATPGTALIVPEKTLCGMQTENGLVYTEIIFEKENIMNANVKTNEVFALKDLISYEEGSIANMDVASNPSMKYVLMAFDEGTGLTPHRAPGNAIVFALEGKATIGYEGIDYEISAGECFRFEKNGLHSVTANGRFKMALLLVLE